jgi:lipoprotein-releasing system ATP-binding protein
MSEVLSCRGLRKVYGSGELSVPVLHGIDLDVGSGESVAIVGASGSGKSTLLHLLGGLDQPSGGTVTLRGQELSSLDPAAQGRLRNEALGFVYQFHHLMPEFSALENVAMPLAIRREGEKAMRERAAAMLEEVGLGHRLTHRPGELSGENGREWQSRARWSRTRRACSPTSPRETSTARMRRASSISSWS